MTTRFHIHPEAPQLRLVRAAADVLRKDGVLAYPTDTCYALGCAMGSAPAIKQIQRIRQMTRDHDLSLICRDLSEISTYARVPNWVYRLLKAHTPGPYTFILPATRDVPRRLQNPKRKTVGIRVPDHPVTMALTSELGVPILSSTLQLPGDELPLTDGEQIQERLGNNVDLIVDAGSCGIQPSTVVDLTGQHPIVIRAGKGDPRHFESRRSL